MRLPTTGFLRFVVDIERKARIPRPESSRDSLDEWDSIKHLYVMLALEEEFSVEFSEEEFTGLAARRLLQAIAAKTGAVAL